MDTTTGTNRRERIDAQARAVGARLAVEVDREARELARLIASSTDAPLGGIADLHPAIREADRQYAERTIVAQVVEVLRDL